MLYLSQEPSRWPERQGKDREMEGAHGGQHGCRAVREGESTKRGHRADNKGLTRPWNTVRTLMFVE